MYSDLIDNTFLMNMLSKISCQTFDCKNEVEKHYFQYLLHLDGSSKKSLHDSIRYSTVYSVIDAFGCKNCANYGYGHESNYILKTNDIIIFRVENACKEYNFPFRINMSFYGRDNKTYIDYELLAVIMKRNANDYYIYLQDLYGKMRWNLEDKMTFIHEFIRYIANNDKYRCIHFDKFVEQLKKDKLKDALEKIVGNVTMNNVNNFLRSYSNDSLFFNWNGNLTDYNFKNLYDPKFERWFKFDNCLGNAVTKEEIRNISGGNDQICK